LKLKEKLELENVTFLGPIDNCKMAALFSEAKFFIFPSVNREGNPKALIEAMASGCVCVASNVSGNNDLIEDSVNGFLFPPSDHHALYEVLDRLLVNDELCECVSKRAIESSRKFSVENTLEKELALVKKLFTNCQDHVAC
jgi:glycosyltransferase involved in cell wall biosynthesis